MGKKCYFVVLLALFCLSLQQGKIQYFINSTISFDDFAGEAEYIFDNFDWKNSLKYTDSWTHNDPGFIVNGFLTAKEFNFSSYDSDFGPAGQIMQNSLQLIGDDLVKAQYSFNYNSQTGLTTSYKGTGSVNVCFP